MDKTIIDGVGEDDLSEVIDRCHRGEVSAEEAGEIEHSIKRAVAQTDPGQLFFAAGAQDAVFQEASMDIRRWVALAARALVALARIIGFAQGEADRVVGGEDRGDGADAIDSVINPGEGEDGDPVTA